MPYSNYTSYVMLSAGPDFLPSALMTEDGFFKAKRDNSVAVADTPHIYKRFVAFCWCHAMQLYNKECGFGDYDMWDCENQKAAGGDVCRHYSYLKKNLSKL